MPQYALNVVQFTEATRYAEAMFVDEPTGKAKYLPVIGWSLCEIYDGDDPNESPVSTKVCAMVYDHLGGLVTVHQSRTFVRLVFSPEEKKDAQKDVDLFLMEQKLDAIKATPKGVSN